jgi:phenylacetate-CoA ligase
VPHSRQRRLFYAVADIVANRKRFSAFDFTSATLDTYYDELVRQRPKFIYGYVSMVQQFAAYLHDRGKRLPDSVVCAITTSEMLTDAIRAELRERLGVPVFNEYGCGEVGSIAHECEHGSLHVMAENLVLEIVDASGQPAQSGELVVTDLHNIATPMIRYRLGDFATALHDKCPCGRGLPRLARIHGRAYDFVRDRSGRRFHPEAVIYVFEMMKEQRVPIVQFQVEQVAIDKLLVRVVAAPGFGAEHTELIGTLLHRHVSAELGVEVTLVGQIPREASGKLRLVKSSLPKSDG